MAGDLHQSNEISRRLTSLVYYLTMDSFHQSDFTVDDIKYTRLVTTDENSPEYYIKQEFSTNNSMSAY